MAGSSTDRAFEPIVGERSVGEKCMATTVISFNFGMGQRMLDAAPWNKTHRRKFLELLRIFGDDYDADMIFGCEIGGHKRGPGDQHMRSLSPELQNMTTAFCQNYMSAVKTNTGVKVLKEHTVTSIEPHLWL